MQSSKSNLRLIVISLVAGIFFGWLFFGGGEPAPSEPAAVEHQHPEQDEPTVWTCSMHPQIRKDEPGKCPICGMTLVPVESGGEQALSLSEIQMSEAAMKIAEVETTRVEKKAPFKEVYFPGKVKADERRIVHLTARFGGRVEKLFINFTGQKVRKGEKLLEIYSPDLVTAQKELFEAIKYKEARPSFYEAARNKLRLWDLTEEQISSIEASGEARFYFDVVSPIDGTVTMRHIAEGHYVKEGENLLEVTDLSRVWVMFEAYESDLPWVKLGDEIEFTIRSLPTERFAGKVTFIDPVVDPKARVAYVRTELENHRDLLKPEMFANGWLKTMLPRAQEAVVVTKSAVLWTGKRAIVYVKVPDKEMVFEHREIELGEDGESYYVVTAGLEEGEEVVSNGVFKVDAAAQLESKQSMMTPAGGGPAPKGHAGHGGHAGAAQGTEGPTTAAAEDHSAHPAASSKLDPAFQEQLLGLVAEYLKIKDSLVADDDAGAASAAGPAREALARVEMGLLASDSQHMAWMKAADPIGAELERIASSSTIEDQREAFGKLSDRLYEALDGLGVRPAEGSPLYLEFCPMALGNAGAFWISAEKEIQNPYLGQAMPTCGEVKEPIGGGH